MSVPVEPSPAVQHTTGGGRRWSVLLPAVTFLVGLALGAVVVGVAVDSSDDNGQGTVAASTATGPGTAPSPSGLVVRVPQPCLQVADQAQVAFGILQDAAAAARELDARRLQELVNQAQQERDRTQALISACRDLSATQPH